MQTCHRLFLDFIEMLEPKVVIMDDGLTRFVCPQCGVKYKKVSALRGHMKECGKGAQCPLCPKIVTQRRNLPKHMERHRRDGLMDFHSFIDTAFPTINLINSSFWIIVKCISFSCGYVLECLTTDLVYFNTLHAWIFYFMVLQRKLCIISIDTVNYCCLQMIEISKHTTQLISDS